MPGNRTPAWRPTGWLRLVVVIAVAIAMAYVAWQKQQPEQPPNRPPPVLAAPSGPATSSTSRTTICDQKILDQLGHEVFRGDIDIRRTLDRIKSGKRLSFPNDGSEFQNRERRLPKQPEGYYKEYVHPTPGLSGPGPQRIVLGKSGETYYTPDHYRTFRRMDEP